MPSTSRLIVGYTWKEGTLYLLIRNLTPENRTQKIPLEKHPFYLRKEEALKAHLYQEMGQLKVELDWLKKSALI